MSDPYSKFSVSDLVCEPTRLDKLIAADLFSDVQALLAENIDTIPEMRRFLAIKGYRELRRRLETAIDGRTGEEALRIVALEMRAYAHDRPGLSAATFRNVQVDSPEWRQEGQAIAQLVLGVLAGAGLTGDPANHALRTLRSLVRGFVLHEITSSFLERLDYDETYRLAIEAYLLGLSAFAEGTS